MTKVADIDFQDNTGSTALKYACETGNSIIVAQLLKRKADVFMEDVEGRTCLHGAVCRGHEQIVKLLLKEKGAIAGDLVNVPDYQFRRPIHEAAIGGQMSLMPLLSLADSALRTDWTLAEDELMASP